VAGGPEAAEENPMANSLFTFLNGNDGLNRQTRYSVAGFSRISPLKGLSWDFNFNYRRRLDENRTYSNAQNAKKIRFSDNYVFSQPTALTDMTSYFYHYGNYFYTIENLLHYNITVNEDHDISALAGYQETYYYEYSNNATKKGFQAENLYVPDKVTDMQSIGGSALDRATRSFFGRVNYAYQSKYLFEANLRHDASSRYAAKYRWGTFPSASVGWRITEEEFMEHLKSVFDNLKLRVSYGSLGNTGGDDVGNYEYQATYGTANYPLNNSLQPGFYINVWPNELLSWETTKVANLGIDASLLNSRLNVTLDVYDKYTEGILYQPTIPNMAQGATAPRMNIAEVDNKGIELTVDWNDKIGNVRYSVSSNFAYNHNEVVKYKGEYEAGWVENEDGTKTWTTNLSEVSTGSNNRVLEGRPINEFYLRTVYSGDGTYFNADGTPNPNGGPKDGMIRTEKDMEWLTAMIAAKDANGKTLYTFYPNSSISKTRIWYGDLIYADNNGDGKFGDADDNLFHGISDRPKYNYGFQLAASWKGLDFSMNWAGSAGFKLYWGPTTGYNSTGLRLGLAVPTDIANDHYFYDPENPNDPRTNINAKYSRLTEGESGYQVHQTSTYYLHKGDFLKLKTLTVGYTVPQKWTRRAFIDKFRVFASGENLLNITSFPGQDPEMGVSPGYVSMRQLAVGINVTF
jgi:TonB-linked SusC/RagA family outer membrane protein